MMTFGSTINLTACPEGLSFPTKYIPLSKNASRVTLGRASAAQAKCHPTNGLFKYTVDSDDVPVGPTHAELWLDSGKVYVNDLGSQTGTFVNDVKVAKPTLISSGDIITLGVVKKELPVIMKVTIS